MGKPEESYQYVTVETYVADHTSGLHGKVHVRPVAGQGFSTSLRVRSPKEMRRDYPIGTQFRIYAKLTDREGGEPFLHTHHNWPFEEVKRPKPR
jgi:hypothetical protein